MTVAVIDSSALVEYLRGTDTGLRVANRLSTVAPAVQVPHLCPVEAMSALRGLVLGRKMEVEEADSALARLRRMPMRLHPVGPSLARMWDLRHNLTTYDATYVALTEALRATLITSDAKLAPTYRHYAEVEVIA